MIPARCFNWLCLGLGLSWVIGADTWVRRDECWFALPDRDDLRFQPTLRLSGARGEVVSLILKWVPKPLENRSGLRCRSLDLSWRPFLARFYRMEKVRIPPKQVSYLGSSPGEYFDPLVPTEQICESQLIWVDLEIPRDQRPGKYSLPNGSDLTVWKMVMPKKPSLPLYIHLNSHAVLTAHQIKNGPRLREQGKAIKNYVLSYREHRIEPYGQYLYFYPPLALPSSSDQSPRLDLDRGREEGVSFRQLVLNGALAPPVLFTPNFKTPPECSVLHAIQHALVAGDLPTDSWAYIWDEGQDQPDVSLQALSRAKWVKACAPLLRAGITRAPNGDFQPWIDLFIAVQNHYQAGWSQPFGLYVSCMSQGSCTNGHPGRPTGPPMMTIDAPVVSPRAFFWINEALGAQMSLYYNATERLLTAWTDQYFAGGYGDGTLIYPDRSNAEPNPSIRMKMLRQGSFDVEYIKWARQKKLKFASPVLNQNQWSKSWSDYQQVRDQLGNQLHGASTF